ncbi:MAG: hypothetical protein AB1481_00460 [Candidatus Omnitrophota bacterium]
MGKINGRSFVTIMIVIAVSALFLRIFVEKLTKNNIVQNESYASSALKFLSAALENYAKDNQGAYPESLSLLTESSPAYLDKDYISESPLRGYEYSCDRLEPAGYRCSAVPLECNLTGKVIFTITTGGLLVPEECSKKNE